MKQEIEERKKAWWRESIVFFTRISGFIALPLIGALFLGKYLDRRFESAPWCFIALTAIAFLISSLAIVKEGSLYMRKLEKKAKD